MSLSVAFAAPLSVSFRKPAALSPATAIAPLRLQARYARRVRAVMSASDTEGDGNEESFSLTDGSTDASAILKEMRATASADVGPRTLNTGVTRDADGKSNVWAVEPTLEVQSSPEVPKAAILGAVFAAVAVALLVLPKLPFVNADQF